MARLLSPSPPDGSVRERLLACALRLFARKGYAATTVREIVAEAGVTKPVLYYYFRSKEGLYTEIMQTASGQYHRILEEARTNRGTAIERLLRLADGVLALFKEKIDVARVAYSIYYGPPQGAPVFDFDAYHLDFHGLVRELVQEGLKNREFREARAEDITWLVLGSVHVALETQLSQPETGLDRRGLRRVLLLLFSRLASGPAGQAVS